MNPGLVGAITMAVAVGMGAFGAHGLKTILTSEALNWWEVAVRYQVWHALGLVAIGVLGDRMEQSWLNRSAWLFFMGVLLFSGSLYCLALTQVRGLGAVTPFGGLSFICGWVCLALAFIKRSESHPQETSH